MKFSDVWNSSLFACFMFVLLLMFIIVFFRSVYYQDWSNRYIFHDILEQKDLGCKQIMMKLRVNSENQYTTFCVDNMTNPYSVNLNLTVP